MNKKGSGLRFGPIGQNAVHICVDMQRMFDVGTPWATGWLRKVLPRVIRLCEAQPGRTILAGSYPCPTAATLTGPGAATTHAMKK